MVHDPVCGMEVDEKSTKYSAKYENKTYYFCSEKCKSEFNSEPDKYAEKDASDHNEHKQHKHREHSKHDEHEHHKHDEHEHHKHDDHGSHDHHDHHAHMVEDFRKRFWVALAITIPILILSPMIQELLGLRELLRFPGDGFVVFALATVVYFYGGWPFLKGLYDEIKQLLPGMMTLVAVAITAAYVYSSATVFGLEGEPFFWELSTLVAIMLVGHWIEMKSVMGASKALEELAKLMPTTAHKLMDDGSIKDVPVDEIKGGDKLVIKPGEKLPSDGTIVEGSSTIDESMLTGESVPVSKGEGDQVIGGGINAEGSITIEVTKTGEDTYLSQVMKLVEEAQASKSRTQDLANRAAFWLTIVALGGGAITFTVWFAIIGFDLAYAMERMVTVMVMACPHALGLAVPLVVAVSTAISAKNGLLIRNRTSFERARNIQAVIFDKTGTLTQGKFGVTDTIILDGEMDENELLSYAAAVESRSEHPIAKGITNAVDTHDDVKDFQAIKGKGVEGTVNGKKITVASPGYLKELNLSVENEKLDELGSQGKTVVYVVVDGKLKGAVALADIIREESKQTIKRLKEMGIQAMMLTGDNKKVAAYVSKELGLDDYFAEVLPHEKAEKVKEIQSRGLITAMVGDGVNDAPALAQADVGIAIGAGTDVAVAAADIVLVRNNPLDVTSILGLARATYRKMVQNLGWATGYNVVAIPVAAGVLYTYGIVLVPAVGAMLMSLSTVIVAINSRFLKV
jgi:P-type Cu2+ transporter